MKLLITGATGYLGRHVLRSLVQSNTYEVHALYRSEASRKELGVLYHGVIWHQIDLLDLPALIDLFSVEFDFVIHTAAMVSFDRHARKEIYATNVEGTAHLVNLAHSHHCKQFVHVSSTIALGGSRGREIREEDLFPDKPVHVSYAKSKYLAEQEVWRAHAEGLPVTIISPSFIVGESPAEQRIIDKLKDGLSYHPSGSNGIVHVDDVVIMIEKALNNQSCIGKKIICSADNMDMKDILHNVATINQLKPPKNEVSQWMLRLTKLLSPIISRLNLGLNISVDEMIIAQQKLSYNNQLSKELLDMSYRHPFE